MKRVLMLSAAALALAMAGQANAAKVGNDGEAWYGITGNAVSFCVMGQSTMTPVGGDKNTSINTANNAVPGGDMGATGSDAEITISQLQNNPTDSKNNNKGDTAAAWRAVINLRHSICNHAYSITASSSNGGLAYAGTENGADFAKKLTYTIQANFDGKTGNPKSAHSLVGSGGTAGTLLNSGHASVGDLKLIFDGAADPTAFLLEGSYTDFVDVKIGPEL